MHDPVLRGDVWVSGDDQLLVRQQMAGFPQWRQHMDMSSNERYVSVDRDALVDIIDSVSVISSAAILHADSDRVVISHSSDAGEASASVAVTDSDTRGGVGVCLDLRYLRSALLASEPDDSGIISLDLPNDSRGQVVIEGGGHIEMIMPMHL